MTRANLQLTDHDPMGRPRARDLELVSAPLSALLTMELDGAAAALGFTVGEILLAALGRAVERTIGNGVVGIDVPGYGTAVQPMVLSCAAPAQVDADAMLAGVHHALDGLVINRIVHGVPDDPRAQPLSDALFASGDLAATRPHLGHFLEFRAYRQGGVMVLDWWFDVRSFEPYSIVELAEQLPLAMIELTSEATPVHATHELAMAH